MCAEGAKPEMPEFPEVPEGPEMPGMESQDPKKMALEMEPGEGNK